jgi:hypothetical protein
MVAAAVAAASDKLYVGPACTDAFLVEDIECRQADVRNFLFIERDFVR